MNEVTSDSLTGKWFMSKKQFCFKVVHCVHGGAIDPLFTGFCILEKVYRNGNIFFLKTSSILQIFFDFL